MCVRSQFKMTNVAKIILDLFGSPNSARTQSGLLFHIHNHFSGASAYLLCKFMNQSGATQKSWLAIIMISSSVHKQLNIQTVYTRQYSVAYIFCGYIFYTSHGKMSIDSPATQRHLTGSSSGFLRNQSRVR